MRVFVLLALLIFVSAVNADWWDSFTETVSDGFHSAANWVKETASPAVSETIDEAKEAAGDFVKEKYDAAKDAAGKFVKEKFNQAKEKLQDPETHKTIREWISDKAEKASEFAQTEVLPELKKIYDAATADDVETTTNHDE